MRVLGLDVGDKRIGIAISDPNNRFAVPLTALERRSPEDDVAEIARLAASEDAGEAVVGLPVSLDGVEREQARRAREFAARLESVGLRVRLWDERLSTAQAERLLRRDRPQHRREKGAPDALAAAIILQGYLDSGREAASSE
ncbi:MAG: Holliday junction resolvase RuvX [Dehalococcoidia bacterium]|nr:Holliday junction resolvase RuvX [Dehalococcoidia bacterium]